mmetsp:Transcript_148718/g.386667  ORF Transcript_148718/g.386667 Transcript_148718/m.386667 type:complete len:294 (-) Transcript_148718:140-1021(-)
MAAHWLAVINILLFAIALPHPIITLCAVHLVCANCTSTKPTACCAWSKRSATSRAAAATIPTTGWTSMPASAGTASCRATDTSAAHAARLEAPIAADRLAIVGILRLAIASSRPICTLPAVHPVGTRPAASIIASTVSSTSGSAANTAAATAATIAAAKATVTAINPVAAAALAEAARNWAPMAAHWLAVVSILWVAIALPNPICALSAVQPVPAWRLTTNPCPRFNACLASSAAKVSRAASAATLSKASTCAARLSAPMAAHRQAVVDILRIAKALLRPICALPAIQPVGAR